MKDLCKILRAIAEGYPIKVRDDRFIIVENPDYHNKQDQGVDPFLVLDVDEIETSLGKSVT